MACFRIFLVGPVQSLLLEFAAANVCEIISELTYSRFIEGRTTGGDDDGPERDVLVATSRIQLIMELVE